MTRTGSRLLLAAAFLAAGAPAAAQSLPSRPVLTLEAAKRMVAAAEAHARTNDWNVVVAIVDAGGHPVLLQRMDETQWASADIALDKARGAAAFRRPTRRFAELVAGGAVGVTGLRHVVTVTGGLPIVVDGHTVGAIGVSGVTSDQDEQIAQAGLDALASP